MFARTSSVGCYRVNVLDKNRVVCSPGGGHCNNMSPWIGLWCTICFNVTMRVMVEISGGPGMLDGVEMLLLVWKRKLLTDITVADGL